MYKKLRKLSFEAGMLEKMSNWLTVEKIDNATWAISEYGHWEEPHCYLLVGKTKAALIDTGLGVESIKQQVEKLTNLPVMAIVTHAHWDHIGGVAEFSNVAIHKADSDWLENGLPLPNSKIQENFALRPTTKPLPIQFNLKTYTTPRVKPSVTLSGDEAIDLGDRKLQIIHTPGHSPGSICVYEQEKGYLFTGDTLYKGTLYMNYESTDPAAFADSINTLASLNITRIFPGHHETPLEPTILAEASAAFTQLKKHKKLKHGSGLHAFKNIKVLV